MDYALYLTHFRKRVKESKRQRVVFCYGGKAGKTFPCNAGVTTRTPVLDDVQIVSLYFDTFVQELTTCY